MDTNLVKKVMTLKSGKFIFSRKYSQEKLLGLLVEARVLYQTVGDLPILPKLAAQLKEEVIRRSIFGTAAIEGNPLTEEEVGLIISEADQTKETDRARTEIRNLKTAYDITNGLGWAEAASELDEEVIRKIHKTITLGIEHKYNVPGQYRNIRVEVGDRGHGGVYVPPKCLPDIEKLLKEFIVWINSGEVTALEPPIRAALAHYYLALIHPFGDGNGRTARIV
ncbi:MAG: Fic family protein, partial [Thermodesulfobacteriota bacterium]|nr:Fic family protein [Thermodesulfobacteriota bacterium]